MGAQSQQTSIEQRMLQGLDSAGASRRLDYSQMLQQGSKNVGQSSSPVRTSNQKSSASSPRQGQSVTGDLSEDENPEDESNSFADFGDISTGDIWEAFQATTDQPSQVHPDSSVVVKLSITDQHLTVMARRLKMADLGGLIFYTVDLNPTHEQMELWLKRRSHHINLCPQEHNEEKDRRPQAPRIATDEDGFQVVNRRRPRRPPQARANPAPNAPRDRRPGRIIPVGAQLDSDDENEDPPNKSPVQQTGSPTSPNNPAAPHDAVATSPKERASSTDLDKVTTAVDITTGSNDQAQQAQLPAATALTQQIGVGEDFDERMLDEYELKKRAASEQPAQEKSTPRGGKARGKKNKVKAHANTTSSETATEADSTEAQHKHPGLTSWNCMGLGDSNRVKTVQSWLRKSQVPIDFCCLQELKANKERVLFNLGLLQKEAVVIHDQSEEEKGGAALLISSKFKVEESGIKGDGQVAWATVTLNNLQFSVASVYASNRRNERILLWRWLENLTQNGVWFLMGDWNQVELPEDSNTPSTVLHGSEERAWKNLVEKADLVDNWLVCAHQIGPWYTRQQIRGDKLELSRLDRLYISNGAEWIHGAAEERHVATMGLSNHLPVEALINMNTPVKKSPRSTYTKLQTEAFKDPEALKELERRWATVDAEDPRIKWCLAWKEAAKMMRDYSQKQKEDRKSYSTLATEVAALREQVQHNTLEELIQELQLKIEKLRDQEKREAVAWKRRSREKWTNLGDAPTRELISYLGSFGGVKITEEQIVGALLEKLHRKINHWSTRVLTWPGRVCLLKHALKAIPNYTLLTLGLSNSGYAQLENICRSFLWGKNDLGSSKTPLIAWKYFALRRDQGGLDIIPFQLQGRALKMRHIARILSGEDVEWAAAVRFFLKENISRGTSCRKRRYWSACEAMLLHPNMKIRYSRTTATLMDCWKTAVKALRFCGPVFFIPPSLDIDQLFCLLHRYTDRGDLCFPAAKRWLRKMGVSCLMQLKAGDGNWTSLRNLAIHKGLQATQETMDLSVQSARFSEKSQHRCLQIRRFPLLALANQAKSKTWLVTLDTYMERNFDLSILGG
ncbi:hypothetical protein R1sor_010069 [Riccia sorocarpa]|uniref:Endonuclease/exonuclease/phosphatase domain-containing protein n=1 Tax=Riccia sorocarpa TaxID=122646 RepID=A0ABD3HX72_9MARC